MKKEKARGRPKEFEKVLCVRIPALVDLRLQVAAKEQGRTISALVRKTLGPVFGGDRDD